MTKQIHIALIEPDGNGVLYGPQIVPNDLNLAQTYAQGYTRQTIEDFLVSEETQVAGFDILVSGGLAASVTIKAPGRVYQANGLSFELADDQVLSIEEPNGQGRVDLVYAKMEQNVPSGLQVRPYKRLLQIADYEPGPPPSYAPIQMNEPTELHNRIVVGIRQGVPSATPASPALQSNEVGLYLIKVGKFSQSIGKTDVIDLRNKLDTLRTLNELVALSRIDINALIKRFESLPSGIQVQLEQVFGTVVSLQEAFALLYNRFDRLSLPEVLRPKLDAWDVEQGKIDATGNVDGATPVVDIELNSTVSFGDTEFTLNQKRFFDKTRIPRLAQISGGAATVVRDEALSLANVFAIQSDGGGDFVERAQALPVKRSRAACAGRGDGGSGSRIEIFGGLGENNLSKLGDWYSYSIPNDTLTPRVLTGDAIPSADRAFMFSCGSQFFVLLCAAYTGITNPRWFRVNAESLVVQEHTGTIPTGNWFFGDFITPGFVFIIAVNQINDSLNNTAFWLYDVNNETFQELGVTGNIPDCRQDWSAGCYYRDNEFVLVEYQPGQSGSGKTYVFNLLSLTWTRLGISSPYGGTIAEQHPVTRFRMANVNGRPVLVGGLLSNELDPTGMRVWELNTGDYLLPNEPFLKRPVWSFFDTDVPPLYDPAVASEVPGDQGPSNGRGFMIAGQSRYVEATNRIYASVQGGILETTFDGSPAITISDASTFASFVIPVYNATFQVASYVASLTGQYSEGMVKLEVSLDAGDHWHEIHPDQLFIVTDSDTPGVRHLRITLYSFKTSKPIIAKVHEVFDEDGVELEDRIVLRFNAHTDGVRGLYMDRFGWIRLEEDILPSTWDRALLAKIQPTGPTDAPIVKTYVNKRKSKIRYRGTKGGTDPVIDNELATPASFVTVQGVAVTTKHLYDVTEPDFPFDDEVAVPGITTGDDYIVILEG